MSVGEHSHLKHACLLEHCVKSVSRGMDLRLRAKKVGLRGAHGRDWSRSV